MYHEHPSHGGSCALANGEAIIDVERTHLVAPGG